MKNKYRKNHYIPEFYLKNFVNDDNHFFVFDKEAKWNKIILKSPSNICFQRDRNTFFFESGEIYKGLEKETYGHYDNLHAETFNLLNKSEFDEFPWTMRTIGDLDFFVPLTYWRAPISDEGLKKKISESNFFNDVNLILKDSEGKELKISKDFKDKILNDDNFSKGLPPILAYSSFGKPHKINERLEWRIIYLNRGKTNITSDNPIIFKEEPKSFEDFRSIVIFPATRNKILIRVNEDSNFNVHNSTLQDIQIFHQAKRYVIGSNKEYLLKIKNEYEKLKKKGDVEEIKSKLFENYK